MLLVNFLSTQLRSNSIFKKKYFFFLIRESEKVHLGKKKGHSIFIIKKQIIL